MVIPLLNHYMRGFLKEFNVDDYFIISNSDGDTSVDMVSKEEMVKSELKSMLFIFSYTFCLIITETKVHI